MSFQVNVFSGKEQTFDALPGMLNSFEIMPSGSTTIKMSIPMVDIHGAWHCNMSSFQLKLPWKLDFNCALNQGMPYLAFFNSARNRACAVATTNLLDDTEFHAALNQQNCTYDLTIEISGSTPFTLTVDRRDDIPFPRSLAQWRQSVMPENLYFPAAAWEPVFCTWYVVHGEVTAKWIERQAIKARALGFGTLIVDDGWCYDEFKRVTPETLVNWYNTIGDWNISAVKFPDFKEHVKKIQNTGLKYLLWVAPHFIGKDSTLYAEHPDWCFDNLHEGCRHLDIRNHDAVDFITGKLVKLAVDNGLDGLKIDFLNIVRPSIEIPQGQNTAALVEKISTPLRQYNPDALIEFRQGYATIGMLPYATQFRAGDVPFDWALNFRRLADIRLSLGDRMPVHADPAYWAENEYPENVARHMMVMLMGVPMLSMDLNLLPAEHISIVQYYLALYKKKQLLLNSGHWEFIFNFDGIGAATVENDTEMMAFILDDSLAARIPTAANGRKLTVLNISSADIKLYVQTAAPGEIIR